MTFTDINACAAIADACEFGLAFLQLALSNRVFSPLAETDGIFHHHAETGGGHAIFGAIG